MINYNRINNNRGFTVLEVAIGVGMVAVVTTALLATQLFVSKDQMNLQNQLDQTIDGTLAERILFNDFANIDPSYNNLILADDSGLGFFDYYPDIPAGILKNVTRKITMSPDSAASKTFTVLAQDKTAGALLIYDPTAAYKIGSAPTDFNVAASLEFQSLNYNNWVAAARPAFWSEGNLLMLDTAARLRPLSGSTVDMTVAPRSPTFVGFIAGQAVKSFNGTNVGGMFNYTQPDTGAAIDSVDTFLRNAPSVGGGQSLIRLRAVKLTQYYLQIPSTAQSECKVSGSTRTYKSAQLFKKIYKNGTYTQPFMLADRVCSFELSRDSVLKRMIYFKIYKPSDTTSDATTTAGL